MEIPGWVFVLVGTIVAVISFIIYANTGSFQLFILIGVVFLIYGFGKMAVQKMRAKNENKLNQEMAKYSKPTTFKDLPIGQEYYRQQYGKQPSSAQLTQRQQMPAQRGATHPMHNQHQANHPGHATQGRSQIPSSQIQQENVQAARNAQHGHAHRSHPGHTNPQAYHSPYAYCKTCGQRNHANVNFCANCGTRMR
jgi:hypothetical protein